MEILARLFATLIAVSVVLGWVYGISFLVDAPLTFQSAAMAFVKKPLTVSSNKSSYVVATSTLVVLFS